MTPLVHVTCGSGLGIVKAGHSGPHGESTQARMLPVPTHQFDGRGDGADAVGASAVKRWRQRDRFQVGSDGDGGDGRGGECTLRIRRADTSSRHQRHQEFARSPVLAASAERHGSPASGVAALVRRVKRFRGLRAHANACSRRCADDSEHHAGRWLESGARACQQWIESGARMRARTKGAARVTSTAGHQPHRYLPPTRPCSRSLVMTAPSLRRAPPLRQLRWRRPPWPSRPLPRRQRCWRRCYSPRYHPLSPPMLAPPRRMRRRETRPCRGHRVRLCGRRCPAQIRCHRVW